MSSPQSRERKRPFAPRPAFRRRSKNRKPGDALTRLAFRERNPMSESHYFKLKRQGRGPREIEVDGIILITPQAEADWRAEREAETAAKRQREREAAALNTG